MEGFRTPKGAYTRPSSPQAPRRVRNSQAHLLSAHARRRLDFDEQENVPCAIRITEELLVNKNNM